MATVRETVIDPDGTGDYTSFDLWEDAWGGVGNSGDCVGEDEIAKGRAICTGGTADTKATGGVDGWTSTDATHYIWFYVDPAYRHLGYWSDTGNYYRMVAGAGWDPQNVNISISFVIIEGVALKTAAGPGGSGIRASGNTGWTYIRSCLINGAANNSATNFCTGIQLYGTPVGYVSAVVNCVAYGFTGTSARGIYAHTAVGAQVVYFNTAADNTVGIQIGNAPIALKNNVAKSNTTDYAGGGDTADSENNASGDGTAPGSTPIDLSGYSDAYIFSAPASNDYRPNYDVDNNPISGSASDLSADARYPVSTDFEEETRLYRTLGFDDAYVPPKAYTDTKHEQLHDKISEWALAGLFHPRAYYP